MFGGYKSMGDTVILKPLNKVNYDIYSRGSSCSVVANMLECDIIVNRSELQSQYYIHFQTNTLWKDMNPLIF